MQYAISQFVLLVATAFTLPAAAQDAPKRKSGLWEVAISGSSRPGAMQMTQCVDQSRDDAFTQMGEQMQREMKCTRTDVKRGAGTMSFESACDFGSMKMTTKSVITGNFDSAYKMEMKTKYDPPMAGKTDNTTVIEAKWLGACKPGQRPGDVTMPGGMTMNMYDMLDPKKK